MSLVLVGKLPYLGDTGEQEVADMVRKLIVVSALIIGMMCLALVLGVSSNMGNVAMGRHDYTTTHFYATYLGG